MNAYICVTYAQEDRDVNDAFCRSLSRYGFRYRCIHENSDPVERSGILTEAALLIALTSTAADHVETVGADIRRAMERQMTVLCVSLDENPLDKRFCVSPESGATRIPYPVGKTPDRHSVALFIHRLFVRHLSRYDECFIQSRCSEDGYGTVVSLAHSAHRGDGDACYALGCAYEAGESLPNLENEAAIWMERAADKNVPDALIRMGMLRLQGKGTERSPEIAFDLFDRAAALEDCRGEYRLALCYLEGWGVVKDLEQGAACLQTAARAGYGPALYRLGCLYRDGEGVARSIRTAMILFHAAARRLAADSGELCIPTYGRTRRYTCVTMRHLRRSVLRRLLGAVAVTEPECKDSLLSETRCMGRNRFKVDSLPEDAFKADWMSLTEKSEDREPMPSKSTGRRRGGVPREPDEPELFEAALALGHLLAGGDVGEGIRPAPYAALRWYRYALRLGCVEAAYVLGDLYRQGRGLPAIPARAAALYRLAAEGGSLRGQFAYAVCCEQGIGVPEDPLTAVTYYRLAAESGYGPAQNNLGGCYESGRGILKNELLAVEWYSRAAAAGVADARCRLGICYEMGRGVAMDMDHALRLYEAAATQGHAYAQYRLGLFFHRRAQKRDEPNAAIMATESVSRAVPKGSVEGETPVSALDREHVVGDPLEEDGTTHEEGITEEAMHGISDRLQALRLYRRSASGGSPEGAYALYICYHQGLGVSRDPLMELDFLRLAAEGGHLQATFELGLCYMEGRNLPRDPVAAVACFRRAVNILRSLHTNPLWSRDGEAWNDLPPGGMPLRRAAGSALYLLGYCKLYGIGEVDNTCLPLDQSPSASRVEAALPYLQEAAEMDHTGALTLLGDLHAYGLMKNSSASAEEESLRCYLEAGRAGTDRYDRHVVTGDRTDSTLDALLSLAKRSLQTASQAEDEGDAELSRVSAWHSFSDSANLGSVDALVGMAECLYWGWGESRNPTYAKRMLYRAVALNRGRVEAAVWLGDLLRSTREAEPDPKGADAAYLQGLESPCVESECGPYTFGLRRLERRKVDEETRTEVYYRLATLRAVYFADGPDRRESFPYLAEAILRGHQIAIDDLARMYAYETTDPHALRDEETSKKPSVLSRALGKRARFRRLSKRGEESIRSEQAEQMHHAWMSDYYVALFPEPIPFTKDMCPVTVLGDTPAYVTAEVTPEMRIDALCYLGECFFEGRGLPVRPEAAVACYRAAVAVPFKPERNKPMPKSRINALYSLGWCQLYGVGTATDAAAAVKLLNGVAKSHSGAAYTLGICHEEGRGVLIPNAREALKHYRKAQTLGHPKAAERVLQMKKLLQLSEEDT